MDQRRKQQPQEQKQRKQGQPSTQNDDPNKPLVLMEMKCSYDELLWLIDGIASKTTRTGITTTQTETTTNTTSSSTSTTGPRSTEVQQQQVLPSELIQRIASFLTVLPVDSTKVIAVRASSSDGRHDLQSCLDKDKSTWWLSEFGSMPLGTGEEYVEFQLAPKTNDKSNSNSNSKSNVCRLSTFGIEIPPLPMGPLSVSRLRLEIQVENDMDAGGSTSGSSTTTSTDTTTTTRTRTTANGWKPISPIWNIKNVSGLQTFQLHPPVDVNYHTGAASTAAAAATTTAIRVVCLSNQMSQVAASGFTVSSYGGGPGTDDDDDAELHAMMAQFTSVGYYYVTFQ